MASASRGLLEELALLEMQRPSRKFRSLRIVRDHYDGFAMIAVQHLQQSQDLVRRLTIQVTCRLVTDQ